MYMELEDLRAAAAARPAPVPAPAAEAHRDGHADLSPTGSGGGSGSGGCVAHQISTAELQVGSGDLCCVHIAMPRLAPGTCVTVKYRCRSHDCTRACPVRLHAPMPCTVQL